MERRQPPNLLLFPVFLAVLTALATPATGQTGPDLLLKQFRAEDQFELNSDWYIGLPTETNNLAADGNAFDLRTDIFNVGGRIRLTSGLSDAGFARAQPRAGFSVNAVQFDSLDPAIPDRMLDASVGVGMGVLAYSGWLGGITIGVGNANANNEDDGNAPYVEANFAIGKTFESGDAFGIVINFDGNRTVLPDWPLPGVQYQRKLRDALTLSLGFPFSGIVWEPNDAFTLRVDYVIPDLFNARADYTIVGDLGVFSSFSSSTLAVHWDQLADGGDRIFFDRSQIELGLSYEADPEKVKFFLSIGYAFAQELNVGFDTRDVQSVAEFDDGIYFRTGFELRL